MTAPLNAMSPLERLTATIGKTQQPGPWFTWSDWWGMAALSLAVLYLMRGQARGESIEDWLRNAHEAMAHDVTQIVANVKAVSSSRSPDEYVDTVPLVSVRTVPIDDPYCPCCFAPTLEFGVNAGCSTYNFDDGLKLPAWVVAVCGECRTKVERHLVNWRDWMNEEAPQYEMTEEVSRTRYGAAIARIRELEAQLEKLSVTP